MPDYSGNSVLIVPVMTTTQRDQYMPSPVNGAIIYNSTLTRMQVRQNGAWNNLSVIPQGTYTPTNVTTDRSFDANNTTIDELADVVGTMIADGQAAGVFG